MSENINLSIPAGFDKDKVLFKIEKRKDADENTQKFRSFRINDANIPICIGTKQIPFIELYKLLYKYGIPSTVPSCVKFNNTIKKYEFFQIDWTPHNYNGPNNYFFNWTSPINKEEIVKCSLTSNGPCHYIRVHDMTIGLGEKIITEILNELFELYKVPKVIGQLTIYTTFKVNTSYTWSLYGTKYERSIDSIYIDNDIKNKLVKKLTQFYASSEMYDKYGITWKQVYILYGPAGTGKTSTVMALASIFKKGIAKLTVNKNLDSQSLENLIKSIPADHFLLIEDVDALFTGREATREIDFSTVLNLLDGMTAKRGLVIFLTTNHLDKLDSALVRPGRVDMLVQYYLPTIDNIKAALKILGSDYTEDHESFIDMIRNKMSKITIPKLQQYIFDCIMDEKKTILEIGDYFD